ncbi:MAG: hypothetical protein O3A00_16800 [Planctomycetota bacterium]|nr:hypothetical protein [Planctomycetota bacterium]
MSRSLRLLTCAMLLCSLSPAMSNLVLGCPFCPPAQQTLSEKFSDSDAVLLAQWVNSKRGSEGEQGQTTFSITQVAKGDAAKFKPNTKHVFGRFRDGKVGDLFLLMGVESKQGGIEWDTPLEITETGFQYMLQAPAGESPVVQRLSYFLKFLQYPDPMISNDAYMEFAKASYADVALIRDKLSAKKLREWIGSTEVAATTRRGLYGMMLGLCGGPDDAEFMRELIVKETDDFRLGIDGVMGGYLLLVGDRGVDDIERTKLKRLDIPFSETYSAMQAIRFIWDYGENQVSRDRLKVAMRVLLDQPKLAEIVIRDLARWKDWSVQDRLMTLFDTKGYDNRFTRRAIAAYMIAGTRDVPKDAAAKTPPHADAAKKHLMTLREKDDRIVKEAKDLFFD